MPNINHNTLTSKPLVTFTDGDTVLCPSVGDYVYELFYDAQSDRLALIESSTIHHYRMDGKVNADDSLPSIFHDSQANGDAIDTLYGIPDSVKEGK